MAKYRKRPIVVEAVQVPTSADDTEGWLALSQFLGEQVGPEAPVIRTLEGDMASDPGGWVIKGVKGEFYPCKPDIFAQLYDLDGVHTEDSPFPRPPGEDDPCLSKWQPLPGESVGKFKLTLDRPDGTRSACAFSTPEEMPEAMAAMKDLEGQVARKDYGHLRNTDGDCTLKDRCPMRPGTLTDEAIKQEELDGSSHRVVDEYGFVNIKFQLGPVKEFGENGTTIEAIIDLLVARLRGFQDGPFKCDANVQALAGLNSALASLEERTADRQARGVEGTNSP